MRRRIRWSGYQPTRKKPPPERGIKVEESGSTWWGRRWIEALEGLSLGYASRLARGRTYARAGRTHDLVVKGSKVTAKVTGSRVRPYRVTLVIGKFSDAVWNSAISAMAGKAQFAAELLAGRMPQEIDAAFEEAGVSVFPVDEIDLATACTCPDWANPCKHVAATHYVLGEALDRDPFLLFELRGRSKTQVLDGLRRARAGDASEPSSRKRRARLPADSEDIPSVSLDRVAAADYDRLRQPLPELRLDFTSPTIASGLVRQLGAPAGWRSDASPARMFEPMIHAAAKRAFALAMAERPESDRSDHPDDDVAPHSSSKGTRA